MTAATADISSPEIKYPRCLAGNFAVLNDDVLFGGTILARDYADEIQNAADTEGLVVVGRCPLGKNNADDGLTSEAEQGIFRFANSSTYPCVRSALQEPFPCFVEDNKTVAAWSTNLVAAGLIYDVDANGVWVDMRPAALAIARAMRPPTVVAKTAAYTVTAAIAFGGRTLLSCALSGGGALEITLPSAVAGMRVGVKRSSATAADDVTIQAAAGDIIQASDGFCAAGKQIDNTVDAISAPLWIRAVNDGTWIIDNPYPGDVASWVKNDA